VIRPMTLSSICGALQGDLVGPDASFDRVCTDTRTLQPNDLYVALVGQNFNGNKFVAQAAANGACAAIVSELSDSKIPQLRVVDTTIALAEIAKLNRQLSSARVVAITGSQGKTSVKEMLGSIMRCAKPSLVTQGNLNNHIGVPLTLLRLESEHAYAVIELGASGPGEIAYTVRLAQPHVAVITNAAETHVEGFGSLQGVVETKGEIIDGLAEDGVVVLNASDSNFHQWRARAGKKRVVTFAVQLNESTVNSDYMACNISTIDGASSQFTLRTPSGDIEIDLDLLGTHNVANAVASAAAAIELGASLEQVQEGLSLVSAVPGRLARLKGLSGSSLIDDSYNASPSSFQAAINVLSRQVGRRILIMGDMGELGVKAEEEHRHVGEYASLSELDDLWTVGTMSSNAALAFGPAARHFDSKEELVKHAKKELGEGVVVLIKGSRSSAMDEIVKKLSSGENA